MAHLTGTLEISSFVLRQLLVALTEDRKVMAEIRTLPDSELAGYAEKILERAKEKNKKFGERLKNEADD